MSPKNGMLEEFISDMEPFFYGKRMSLVDVGAFDGSVFDRFQKSKLKFREVHLFEPNPKTYDILTTKVTFWQTKHIYTHKLAMSSQKASLKMKLNNSMTTIVDTKPECLENYVTVSTLTLDSFVDSLYQNHISILKIDVEGHEMAVLEGGRKTFEKQFVDVVYIEAGLDIGNPQQTYYRKIDDFMTNFGYRIFKIYEQTNEWIDDSPALRRVNIAYISDKFSRHNPYKISKELFGIKAQFESFKSESNARVADLHSAVRRKEEELANFRHLIEEEGAKTALLLQHVEIIQSTNESQVVKIRSLQNKLEALSNTIEVQKATIKKLDLQLKPFLKPKFSHRLWAVLTSPRRLKSAVLRRYPKPLKFKLKKLLFLV